MPRTETAMPGVRFCGACGYEMAADDDGRCPMCPRFEQLRIASRRPTIAEYRAILASRGANSVGGVIRTPGLRRVNAPGPRERVSTLRPALPAPRGPEGAALHVTARRDAGVDSSARVSALVLTLAVAVGSLVAVGAVLLVSLLRI